MTAFDRTADLPLPAAVLAAIAASQPRPRPRFRRTVGQWLAQTFVCIVIFGACITPVLLMGR